ncbi:MAG: hypothetical protein IJZ72_06890 [Oscillospiraceae bacterium]|nr:hypothetical protein [Oscillospiraceae bacterium]
MTKGKKIIKIIGILIAAFPIAFVILLNWDTISSRIGAAIDIPQATSEAKAYYKEKYGEKPNITGHTPYYEDGFFLAGDSYCDMITFHTDRGDILWTEHDGCYDSIQYEDVCNTIEEAYFHDSSLGEYISGEVSVEYGQDSLWMHATRQYFNGNLAEFAQQTNFTLHAEMTYSGDINTDYRQALREKLDVLDADFNAGFIRLNIKDIQKELTDPTYSMCPDTRTVQFMPKGAEYMETIAGGYIRYGESEVYSTRWCDIDEYTAVSDVLADEVLTDGMYSFEADDRYVGKEIYRSHSGTQTDNIFIPDNGYAVSLQSGNPIFLRFDKAHYNINETTIPIIIYEPPYGKSPKYVTAGWQSVIGDGYDIYDAATDGTWFYYDEKYMYILLGEDASLFAEHDKTVLSFVQLEDVIAEKMDE